MVNLVAVSYLNTKPFLYGLEHFFNPQAAGQGLNIRLDIPALCAEQMMNGQAQLGLMPAAKIPEVPNAQIIGSYCIGAHREVKTVSLFSNEPLEKIKTVYLDYQSRTSALLVQILARHHWKINPRFEPAPANFEQVLPQLGSFLMIGDRTIGLERQFPYVYDLSEHWYQLTGLPFVFAAWVANTGLTAEFVQHFEHSLGQGLAHREQVAALWQPRYGDFSVSDYFYKYLSYELDAAKREGLRLFLELVGTFGAKTGQFSTIF